MIKFIKRDDISSTPFVVSKKWRIPGFKHNFLLSDTGFTTSSIGNSTIVGINYTDFKEGSIPSNFSTGSFNYYDLSYTETSRSLRNYFTPYDFYGYSSVNSSSVEDFNLVLLDSQNNFAKIEEGVKVEKYLPFIPESSSKNPNGSYKRLIYDQLDNLYFSKTFDAMGLSDSNDYFSSKCYRYVGQSLKCVTIPKKYLGDSIKQGSVLIKDSSFEDFVDIIDDGDGNLVTSGSVFESVITNETESFQPNIGYSVAISEEYAAIGCPSNRSNLIKTGSVKILKKDRLISNDYEFERNLSLITESLQSVGGNISTISQSSFGCSVSLYENLLVVGTRDMIFISASQQKSSSAFLSIYNLDTTSSVPIQTITHSLLNNDMSQSFAWATSMNQNYLVVGSPFSSTHGKKGSVYLYKSGSNGFSYEGYLTGSDANDVFFGAALEIDKQFNKIVVGNKSLNNTSSKVYLFESSSTGWSETKTFTPTKGEENLFFLNSLPYYNQNNTMDGFGNSVSIFCEDESNIKVAIGCPYDRNIIDFSGSSCSRNGAVYIFEKQTCYLNTLTQSHWNETRIFGDGDAFLSNRFGHAVSLTNTGLIVSSPKFISEHSSSHIIKTLHQSPIDEEYKDYDHIGMLYVYTSSLSSSWDVLGKYKPKKLTNRPHAFFGFSVNAWENKIVTGDPVVFLDTSIDSVNYIYDGQNVSSSIYGNFHILDIEELKQRHHVGNVFYNTGKIIITNESRRFRDIFENPYNDSFTYDLQFSNLERFFEKEIICTILPGEFNFSSNPTSYEYTQSVLDLNKNGKFDFVDCDNILRSIYRKHHSSETWWKMFSIENPNSESEKIESSIFYYHLSSSFERDSSISLIESKLSDAEYSSICNAVLDYVDFNGDGAVDERDIKILWKYFINRLTPVDISSNINNRTISRSSRKSYQEIVDYLDSMCVRNPTKYIKSEFLSDRSLDTFSTGSRIAPYITTIGLYDGLDLIGVAKLGTPIKNEGYFPLNFSVRFDI